MSWLGLPSKSATHVAARVSMNVVTRLVTADQTVVVVEDGDCIALLSFFGDFSAGNLDQADGVVFLGVGEAQRLATALL